jgi:hypothetical protein
MSLISSTAAPRTTARQPIRELLIWWTSMTQPVVDTSQKKNSWTFTVSHACINWSQERFGQIYMPITTGTIWRKLMKLSRRMLIWRHCPGFWLLQTRSISGRYLSCWILEERQDRLLGIWLIACQRVQLFSRALWDWKALRMWKSRIGIGSWIRNLLINFCIHCISLSISWEIKMSVIKNLTIT